MVRGQLKRSSALLATLIGGVWGSISICLPLFAAPNPDMAIVAGIIAGYLGLFGAIMFGLVMWNLRRVLGRLRIAQFGTAVPVTVVKTGSGQRDYLVYEDPNGVQTEIEVGKTARQQLFAGDELTELVDPETGATFLPEAFEIEFEEVRDIRTTTLPPPKLQDDFDKGKTAVFASPLPAETGALARLVDPRPVDKIGQLSWDDEVLTLKTEDGEVTLRWDRPWSVALGAATVTPDQAELHLRIRERNAPPGSPSMQLTTELPQRQISRDVPAQEARYPFIPTAAFQELLPQLLLHAQVTGNPELARSLTTAHNVEQSLPAPRRDEAPRAEPQPVEVEVEELNVTATGSRRRRR